MNKFIVQELRSGKSADEALSNAKNKFLDTAEKKEYFNSQLKDYVNEDKVKEWYNNVRNNNGLYSQGYSEEEGNSSYSQIIAEEEERKGKAALGYILILRLHIKRQIMFMFRKKRKKRKRQARQAQRKQVHRVQRKKALLVHHQRKPI